MKWSRAVHHLEELANTCSDMAGRPATIFPLRVTELWAFGDVLTNGVQTNHVNTNNTHHVQTDHVQTQRDDLETLQVALAVELPVEDVAWLCHPAGAEHWAHATRLSKNPVLALWRSQRAPVWNHCIHRPLLIWSKSSGIAAEALAALRDGTAETLRLPEPTPAEMQARLEAELATSHQALETATATYEQRRFSPGKVEPVADRLWRAAQGYLDVLAATR